MVSASEGHFRDEQKKACKWYSENLTGGVMQMLVDAIT